MQSLYVAVSFNGIKPSHSPAVCGLKIPPRVQVFLWLLSNNKLLTRDNPSKRKNVDDKTCLFCGEFESIHHLFFDCCVASEVWSFCADGLNLQNANSFEAVARWWISNKKHAVLNMCTSAILWSIWKLRNGIRFQGITWSDVRTVVRKASGMLRRWKSLCRGSEEPRLGEIVEELERKAGQPLRISWSMPVSQAAPAARNLVRNGAVVSSVSGVSGETDNDVQGGYFSRFVKRTRLEHAFEL